jgi:hypothetical protein
VFNVDHWRFPVVEVSGFVTDSLDFFFEFRALVWGFLGITASRIGLEDGWAEVSGFLGGAFLGPVVIA